MCEAELLQLVSALRQLEAEAGPVAGGEHHPGEVTRSPLINSVPASPGELHPGHAQAALDDVAHGLVLGAEVAQLQLRCLSLSVRSLSSLTCCSLAPQSASPEASACQCFSWRLTCSSTKPGTDLGRRSVL